MAVRELRILVPVTVLEKLNEVEQRTGIRKEDLIVRAILKVVEEFKG